MLLRTLLWLALANPLGVRMEKLPRLMNTVELWDLGFEVSGLGAQGLQSWQDVFEKALGTPISALYLISLEVRT